MGIHRNFILFLCLLFVSIRVFANPQKITFQSKIYNPDGSTLQAPAVQFKFSLMDPLNTCVIFSETFTNVDLSASEGSIVLSLGDGTRDYPVAGGMVWQDGFNNLTSSYNCQGGGTYSPVSTESRKVVMQFNDGTANGWQTLPAMEINTVPYAMFAHSSERLAGRPVTDFVLASALPGGGTTAASGAASGYLSSTDWTRFNSALVNSADITTALGFTPISSAGAVTSSDISTALTYQPASSSDLSTNYLKLSGGTVTGNLRASSDFTVGGNVGIGTAAPAAALHLAGTSHILLDNDNEIRWKRSDGSLNSVLQVFSNDDVYFDSPKALNIRVNQMVSVVPAMKIDTTGRVGIGTTVPGYALEVSGDISVSGAFKVNGVNISTGAGTVTSVSGSGPISVATGTTTPVVSISKADTNTNGYLSSADWTTFNNKLASFASMTSSDVSTALTYEPASSSDLSTNYLRKDGTVALTGRLRGVDGTIGLPTYSFTNDPDTGVFSVAPNILGLAAGGAEVLRLGSQVVVRSAAPLLVENGGSAAIPRIAMDGATNTGLFWITNSLGFTTAGTERMRINASGDVGIGVTNPAYALQVSGDISVSGNFKVNGVNISTGSGTVTSVSGSGPISVATGTTTPVVSISKADTNTNGYLSSADWTTFNNKLSAITSTDVTTALTYLPPSSGDVSANYLKLSGGTMTGPLIVPSNDFTVGTNQLVVSGGNVGIGVASPVYGFDVNVNTRLNQGVTVANGSAAGPSVRFSSTTSGLYSPNAGADVAVTTAGVERMRINSSGDIGIGVTNPAYALQVSGDISVSGNFKVNGVNIGAGGSGTVTDVTGALPISVATGSSTPVISMTRATAAVDGYLSSGDWTTFNNKLSAITSSDVTTALTYQPASSSDLSTNYLAKSGGTIDGTLTINASNPSGLHFINNQNSIYTDSGSIYIKSNNAIGARFTAPDIQIAGGYTWGTSIVAGSDTGLFRNAAGIVEINNGTVGQYRDLRLRALNPVGGNVGIGTTTPGYALEVSGDISVSGNFKVNGVNIGGGGAVTSTDITTALSYQPASSSDLSTNYLPLAGGAVTGNLTVGQSLDVSKVLVADGSAAFPSVSFSADPTMGMYKAGAGILGIGTAGSARVHINSTGLSLQSGGYLLTGAGSQGSPSHTFVSDANTGMYNPAADEIAFTTNSVEKVRIDAAGKVGIGKVPATYALEVSGDVSISGNFKINGVNIGAGGSGTVTDVTGSGPISVATGSSTPVISIARATAAVDGYLSSGDWTTFNNKLSAITSADVTTAYGYTPANSASSGDFKSNGTVAMTAPFRAADGLSNAPSITFSNDPTTGIYSVASGVIGFSGSGANIWRMSNAAFYSAGNSGAQMLTSWGAGVLTYQFANDTNTGIENPSADNLALWTGGASRLRINASGDVGIGTTSPSVKLDVVGNDISTGLSITNRSSTTNRSPNLTITNYHSGFPSSPQINLRYSDGNESSPASTGVNSRLGEINFSGYHTSAFSTGGARIEAKAAQNFTAAANGTDIIFSNSAIGSASLTERMRINASGDVGIGVSNPAYALQVSGDVSVSGNFKINGVNIGAGGVGSVSGAGPISVATGTSTPLISMSQSNGTTDGYLSSSDWTTFNNKLSAITSTDITTALSYEPASSADLSGNYLPLAGGTMTGRLVVPSNDFTVGSNQIVVTGGNVGIGTDTPSAYFEVYQDVNTVNWAQIINPNTGAGAYSMLRVASDVGDLRIGTGSAANVTLLGAAGAAYVSTTSAKPLQFGTSDLERMRIDENGLVGIGTTTPGYALEVSGDISVSGAFKVNGVDIGAGGAVTSSDITAALTSNTTNFAIGDAALTSTTTGDNNTGLGFNALLATTSGASNTAVGARSLASNTTGDYNIAFGPDALFSNVSGSGNIALGFQALNANIAGGYNTAVGYESLLFSASGDTNAGFGYRALRKTTGANNTGLGANAGSEITTGSDNVVIGANDGTSIATLSGHILVSDGQGTERFRINSSGDMGVGTTTPVYKLDVAGDINVTGAFKVNGVDIGSTAIGGARWVGIGTSADVTQAYPSYAVVNSNSLLKVHGASYDSGKIWADTGSAVEIAGTNFCNIGPCDIYLAAGATLTNPGGSSNILAGTLHYETGAIFNPAEFAAMTLVNESVNVCNAEACPAGTQYVGTSAYHGNIGVRKLASSTYAVDVAGSTNSTELCIGGDCKASWASASGASAAWENYLAAPSFNDTDPFNIVVNSGTTGTIAGHYIDPGKMWVQSGGTLIITGANVCPLGCDIYLAAGATLSQIGSGISGGTLHYETGAIFDPAEFAGMTLINESVSTCNGVACPADTQFSGNLVYHGNVGLGIAAPLDRFSINDGTLSIRTSAGGPPDPGTTNSLALQYDYTNGEAYVKAYSNGGNTGLSFGTSLGGVYSNAMRIDASGDVAIGTAFPLTDPLTVVTNHGNYTGVRVTSPNRPFFVAASTSNNEEAGLIAKSGNYEYRAQLGAHSADDFSIRNVTGATIPFTILQNNNVGIGTTAPAARLGIEQPGSALRGIDINDTTNTVNATHILFLAGGVAQGSITTNGSGATSFNTTSDRRKKENIVPTQTGIEELLQIEVSDFNMIDDPKKEKHQGFIAQQLHQVYPDAVANQPGDDGQGELAPKSLPWSVDYGRLTPLIVKSVQDIYKKIILLFDTSEKQAREIASLKEQVTEVKKENAALKEYLCSKDPTAPICK